MTSNRRALRGFRDQHFVKRRGSGALMQPTILASKALALHMFVQHKVVGGDRMKPETDAKGVDREAAASLTLLAAAVLALIVANSPLRESYESLFSTRVTIGLPPLALSKPLLFWINDGLMAVFFFLVGLEIKREVLRGALSSRRTASLPAIAAFGGMVVPAMIYASINWDNEIALRGWAIPAATDIAFAVGVLALLGPVCRQR